MSSPFFTPCSNPYRFLIYGFYDIPHDISSQRLKGIRGGAYSLYKDAAYVLTERCWGAWRIVTKHMDDCCNSLQGLKGIRGKGLGLCVCKKRCWGVWRVIGNGYERVRDRRCNSTVLPREYRTVTPPVTHPLITISYHPPNPPAPFLAYA